MTAIALLTLPLTIASTVLQEEARQEALDQQRAAADRQQAIDQQKQAIAQEQIKLEATAQKQQLLAQQQTATDALTAYYYKSGIDPTTGSAQNALLSLRQRGLSDLNQLTQLTALKQQGASLIGANDLGGGAVAPYNGFPAAIDLLNSIGRDIASLDKPQNNNSL